MQRKGSTTTMALSRRALLRNNHNGGRIRALSPFTSPGHLPPLAPSPIASYATLYPSSSASAATIPTSIASAATASAPISSTTTSTTTTTTTTPTPISATATFVPTSPPNSDYTLDLHSTLFADTPTSELLFSLAILKACQLDPLVHYGAKVLDAVPVTRFVAYPIVRRTFYSHFCAETLSDIDHYCKQYSSSGKQVKMIPDYSIEDAFDEHQWESNLQQRLQMFEDAKRTLHENVSFVPVKITSLGSPHLLEHMSSLITYHQNASTLSSLSWLQGEHYPKAPAYIRSEGEPAPLSHNEEVQLKELLARLSKICRKSADAGIPVLVDAEQTSRQPAINHIVRVLSKQFNTSDSPTACVYNTFQLYLNGNTELVRYEIEEARKKNYLFAAKVVRGAYMVSERERANQNHYESPVLPSKQHTDEEYNTAIQLMIENISDTAVVVASHNAESAQKALYLMRDKNLPKTHPRVNFAQLRGIADSLTHALANKSVRVSKLVPYGPVENIMPYLIRRVQENSSIFGGAQRDRDLMWNQLSQRFSLSRT
eukprot:TRINITY_DN4046_c1_g1_i1.p1 TRINITY_DN4046_c1_g1~~TRINITY_DN4046_c1_g1_i1.p1  ORF type:complete len:542 (+),score=83.67 TRINITY_DN4046_c1_g1_i1:169-1794(+)